jgi:hypothetical protein
MQLSGRHPRGAALALWCGGVVTAAGAYAFVTLSQIAAIRCDLSLDQQRFCVWWQHSALPTIVGMPAVLAFGCYASLTAGSRRHVTIAGVLVVLICLGLRQAAAPVY